MRANAPWRARRNGTGSRTRCRRWGRPRSRRSPPPRRRHANGSSSISGATGRPAPISWRAPQQAGYEALILTVDVPVGGPRLRDARNGFSIPPKLKAKTVLNAVAHPAWWFNLLTTEPLRFASLSSWSTTIAELIDLLFDPTMTIDDLEWLRSSWDGPLVVKGIQNVEDARRVVAAGADVVVRVQSRRSATRPRARSRCGCFRTWSRRSARKPRCGSTPGS